MSHANKRRVSVLGATGSIGDSTLDLLRRNPEHFSVVALTAQKNWQKLAILAQEFKPEIIAIADERHYADLRAALPTQNILVGANGVLEAAAAPADYIMAAITGFAGLAPCFAAVAQGRFVALANKEALVCGGQYLLQAAAQSGCTILPVDSEHNAIFQLWSAPQAQQVRRIILTASGGPCRGMSDAQLQQVTPAMALKHPTWSMGAKISIDSATLMNKGLEVIEAHFLFNLPASKIEVLVHPQSLVHGLVEYADGALLAEMGAPDMRTAIAHTLAYPQRMATPVPSLDLAAIGQLHFEAPHFALFPCLGLAYQALAAGGAAPLVLNAANEVAVEHFLACAIGFTDIAHTIERMLNQYKNVSATNIAEMTALNQEVREHTISFLAETHKTAMVREA